MDTFIATWLMDPFIGKVVTFALGALILVTLSRVLQRWSTRHVKDMDTRYRLRKLLNAAAAMTSVLLLGVVFSDRLGGLTVAFGVAGAGIAFALQEVIASVAGWLAIFMAGFFKVGDRVQLGGIMGDVIDIGVLRTTIMECGQWVKGDLYNGRIVLVANSFVFKEPVFNYSGDFPFLWDEITVPIKYGSDVRLARAIIEKVAREELEEYSGRAKTAWNGMVERYRIEDAQVDPMVSLIANDNWIEFTLRYVVDFKRRRATKNQLFTRILEEIEASGNRVSMASATFHLVEAPVFDVRIAK